jgi:hypothetical protein
VLVVVLVVVLEVVLVEGGTLVLVVVVVPPPPELPPPPPSGPLSAAKVHVPAAQSPGVSAVTRKTPGAATNSSTVRGEPAARQLKAGSSLLKPVRSPAGAPSPSSGREARTVGVRATADWFQTPA